MNCPLHHLPPAHLDHLAAYRDAVEIVRNDDHLVAGLGETVQLDDQSFHVDRMRHRPRHISHEKGMAARSRCNSVAGLIPCASSPRKFRRRLPYPDLSDTLEPYLTRDLEALPRFVVSTNKKPACDFRKRALKRRAWDSNPQPVSRHLISSQTAGQFAYPPGGRGARSS